MTPNCDSFEESPEHSSQNASHQNTINNRESIVAVNTLKRDRFELLSAYLDGEVSAAERRQVEEWLANDPVVQRLYARLMSLRQGLQKMPGPAAQVPVEKTVAKVFERLDRRRNHRILAWGGAAIAAGVVAAVSGIFGTGQSFAPQVARNSTPQVSSDSLMIALNTPVIDIPKAPVANPEKSVVSRALIVE